jgi:hypothetical protein
MDKRFLRAFLTPSRIKVEGYTLFPWCLKYRIWLEGIESPLMRQDAPITVPDLVIALQVCSETGVGRLGWRERWLGLMLTVFPRRFEQACRVFIAYSQNQDAWPKFYEKKEGKGGPSSAMPWELAVICNLVSHGVSYPDALQMPETRAIWLSTAFAINDGGELHLLTTDDEALIDSLSNVEPKTT